MNLKKSWIRALPAAILVLGIPLATNVSAAPLLGVEQRSFELDASTGGSAGINVNGTCDQPISSYGCADWNGIFPPNGTGTPPGYIASEFTADFTVGSSADSSTFATGSKDTLPINPGWQCTSSNNVGGKVDLMNTYAAALRDSNQDLLVYMGAERNSNNGDADLGVWLLQDNSVGCNDSSGTATFTGGHQNGDILLTTGYSSGGNVPSVQAFVWMNGALTGPVTLGSSTNAACPVPPAATTSPSGITGCGTVNSANLTPPWATSSSTPKKCSGTNCALGPNQFFEGGFNITQALNLLGVSSTPCFANILIDTRSSTSNTATIFDYTLHSFPTCGTVTVNKYIDVDESGTNNTGDVTSGAPVSGWSFTVKDSGGNVVCAGTTDTTGGLVCSSGTLVNITPGTYTITETQKSNFYNTDPGPGANGASTVSKTVSIGLGNNAISFGNTCYVAKTFQVTNVPTDSTAPSSITAFYTITSGPDASATEKSVGLTSNGSGTWSATVQNLNQQDSLTWRYTINGSTNAADSITVATNESLASGAYPTCAVTNATQYPRYTVLGSKFKDINGDGVKNGSDAGIAGFQFKLLSGATQIGSTATSAADGSYSFSSVPPGTYTVNEVGPPTGWIETTSNPSVTIHLDGSGGPIAAVGDTPLSDISLGFTPEATLPGTTTPATHATISCTDGGNNSVGSQSGNSYSANGLQIKQSVVTCTYTITDP